MKNIAPIYDVEAEFTRIRNEYRGIGEGAWAAAKWYAEALVRSRAELERELNATKRMLDDALDAIKRWEER